MKFIIIILLFSLSLQAQVKFDKLIFDDKFQHNIVGTGTALITSEIINQTTNLEGLTSLTGGLISCGVTIGKEYIWDKGLKRGVFSKEDIISGCMGSLTGAMIHRIIIDLRYRKEQRRLIKIRNSKELLT